MNCKTTVLLLCSAFLTLGPAGAGSPARLDPGDGAGTEVVPVRVTPYRMALRIEPGAQAPLRPMLGEYALSVLSGELTVVTQGVAEVLRRGEARVIGAGVDFQLLNRGAAGAEVIITVSIPD